MHFLDEKHNERYDNLLAGDKTKDWDTERRSMFYIFASNERLFKSVKKLYDFKESEILFYKNEEGNEYDMCNEPLINPAFSSSETTLIKVVFNLFNSCRFKNLSPIDIFSFDQKNSLVILTAISIRFSTVL